MGVQRNMPRDLLCGPRPAQGMGLRNIRMAQFMEHVDQLMIYGMRTTSSGMMLGACTEGLELALGLSRPMWELEVGPWDKIVTKSWAKNTWKEAQTFRVRIEDAVAKLPPPMEGDFNLTDELMRHFPDERVSFHKNVSWCKECLQVVCSSEIVTLDGKQTTPEMWNGKRSLHLCTVWNWARCKPPTATALMDWKKCIDEAFLLTSVTRRIRQSLNGEVMGSVSWKAPHDGTTQRFRHFENENGMSRDAHQEEMETWFLKEQE